MPKCIVSWYTQVSPGPSELQLCDEALNWFAEVMGDEGGTLEIQHMHFAPSMGKCDTADLVVEIHYGYSSERSEIEREEGEELQRHLTEELRLRVHIRLKPTTGAVFIK